MDCSTVSTLMRCYFSGTIRLQDKDNIVSHLIVCKKCKKEYAAYAKKIGVKFNLIREVQKIYNACEVSEMEAENINRLVQEGVISDKIVEGKHKWTQAAREKDVATLSNVKCVNDFFKEEISYQNTTSEENIARFGWYKVEEMCKTVDALNNIYKLSGGKEIESDEKLE
ncbi:MAG: hypothetical protein NC218_08185 [Acetobacter sp.]|nr:hypothetical protein [Acetobacter sp.]